MSKFDALLRRYKERTTCDPSESIELMVLARISAREAMSPGAVLSARAFRPGAMAAGLLMGLVTAGLMPVATSSAATATTDLAIFAPDAPHLPSTWLGRK